MSRHTDETKTSGGFKPDIGIHNVICCQVVELGTHNTEWEGKVTGKAPMIIYSFEFVDVELEHDGEKYHPMWGIRERRQLGVRCNIKRFLEGWRGRQFTKEEREHFDWGAPLGKCCKLVIEPNNKGNPKLASIAGTKEVFKGMRELHEFWIEKPPVVEFPEWMPEWMQEIIKDSYEYSEEPEMEDDPTQAAPVTDEYDDEAPF